MQFSQGVTRFGRLSGFAITPLFPQEQSALHLISRLYKLGMATEEDLRWLKKEFVSVWKATPADVKSLPLSSSSDYEQLEQVRSRLMPLVPTSDRALKA